MSSSSKRATSGTINLKAKDILVHILHLTGQTLKIKQKTNTSILNQQSITPFLTKRKISHCIDHFLATTIKMIICKVSTTVC